MNLEHLSNEQLHQGNLLEAENEREQTMRMVLRLRETERRMLYADMGYTSLKEYCIQELKYSEGSAWRLIDAMKVHKAVPEVEVKLQSGELNLTQLSMAQTFFRQAKSNDQEKREILGLIESQTLKKTERILAERNPKVNLKPEVRERAIKGQRLEVTLIIDEQLQKELEEIEMLIGKKLTKLELIRIMAKEKLERLRKQNERAEKRKAQPSWSQKASKPTRTPSRITIHELKTRDERCRYVDPKTGRQCEARLGLQTEHKVPWARGGGNNIENLERLCPAHNRLRALQAFGHEKMKQYIPSLN